MVKELAFINFMLNFLKKSKKSIDNEKSRWYISSAFFEKAREIEEIQWMIFENWAKREFQIARKKTIKKWK